MDMSEVDAGIKALISLLENTSEAQEDEPITRKEWESMLTATLRALLALRAVSRS